MRLTIVNLFLGLGGRFGRHPCTKAPAIEPAMCGASIAADGGYMSRWRRGGKVASHFVLAKARTHYHKRRLACSDVYDLRPQQSLRRMGPGPPCAIAH